MGVILAGRLLLLHPRIFGGIFSGGGAGDVGGVVQAQRVQVGGVVVVEVGRVVQVVQCRSRRIGQNVDVDADVVQDRQRRQELGHGRLAADEGAVWRRLRQL